MAFTYLGLARMPTSLGSIRDELMPGLLAIGRKKQMQIESYVEFNRDVLVVKAGEPGNWTTLEISRYEIEDGKHIAKLQAFMEGLMCASKGSVPVTSPQSSALANAYQTTLSAVQDNMYKQAFGSGANSVQQVAPVPKAHEPEPTVEDLKRRHERKLDLGD